MKRMEQFLQHSPLKTSFPATINTGAGFCGYRRKTEFLFSSLISFLLFSNGITEEDRQRAALSLPIPFHRRGECMVRVEHGRQPVLNCARIFLFFSQHHGNYSKKSSMLSPYSMYINDKHCP